MKNKIPFLAVIFVLTGSLVNPQNLQIIKLPAVSFNNDKPLMQAVKDRKSSRDFSEEELSLQDLSNVLWCANGVNRPETGKRTSPSAMNKQDVDVYVVLKEGTYLYEAKRHELLPVITGDYRKDTGRQAFVSLAPVNLLYVSDISKLDFVKEREELIITAAIDAGHCSQNVYLYGAAANLAVVTRTSMDKARMAEILRLRSQQIIIMAQTVGYPKKE